MRTDVNREEVARLLQELLQISMASGQEFASIKSEYPSTSSPPIRMTREKKEMDSEQVDQILEDAMNVAMQRNRSITGAAGGAGSSSIPTSAAQQAIRFAPYKMPRPREQLKPRIFTKEHVIGDEVFTERIFAPSLDAPPRSVQDRLKSKFKTMGKVKYPGAVVRRFD